MRAANLRTAWMVTGVLFLASVVCAAEADNDTGNLNILDESDADYSGWFSEWARYEIVGGVAPWQLIMVFVFLLAGLVLRKISNHVFETRLIPMLEKTRFSFDNLIISAVSKPVGMLILIGGVSAAASILMLPRVFQICSTTELQSVTLIHNQSQ